MSSLKYNSTALVIDDRDPSIIYSEGWLRVTTSAEFNFTKSGADKAGMSATFVFTGTGVEVYGSVGSIDVYGRPVSSYQIDGLPDTQVQYQANVVEPGLYTAHTLFYRSPPLQSNEHTLVITNVNGTPPSILWLDYIVYTPPDSAISSEAGTSPNDGYSVLSDWGQGGVATGGPIIIQNAQETTLSGSVSFLAPVATAFTTGSVKPASATGLPTDSASPSSDHTGAIAGGVVGGVLFLAAVIILPFWFIYRRRRRTDFDGRVDLFGSWPASRVPPPSNEKSEKMEVDNSAAGPSRLPDVERDSSVPRSGQVQPAVYDQGGTPSVLRLHVDSGVRLPPNAIVDVPPVYTDS